jgi:ELWxxDGT repeat protein
MASAEPDCGRPRALRRARSSSGSSIRDRTSTDTPDSFRLAEPTNLGGTLLFAAYDQATGAELWRSDGTRKGTVLVRSWPRLAGSFPQDLTAVNGMLFFTASDGTSGLELWTSDGTAAGTRLVSDIRPGRQGSKPTALSNVNGMLFFGADEGLNGVEPWVLSP